MSTEAAFLAAIAASPLDHLPKLVYADWLEEQNDPRPEFLRLQHALTQLSPTSDEWWRIHTRRTQIASTLDPSWIEAAGMGLEWFGEIRDKSDVLHRITQVAEEGNPAAMTCLAVDYWRGKGDKHDYPNAKKWLQRAADAGYAPAMHLLGLMNHTGVGMWWSHVKKAAELYRRATELGFAPATTALAKMYAGGEGVRQNIPEAIRLYRLAAESGEGEAHRYLGNHYRDGRGLPKDAKEAVKHYRRAIELGEEEAWRPLAALLSKHPELTEYRF